jgi:hypothetical protein
MRLFDCFMFKDELDTLEMRLESMEHDSRVTHVLVESEQTHRGVPKPLVFAQNRKRFAKWAARIMYVRAEPVKASPWIVEHTQRNIAWEHVNRAAVSGDIVFICDLDEIPSQQMLEWRGDRVASVRMRTCIFAVDWEALGPTPPTCVIAGVGWLRLQAWNGLSLGEVRDARHLYPELQDGGFHLSWLGGPESHARKLAEATCHTELLKTPEGARIASGELYRTGGSVITPLTAVDVDENWPRYVYERRCPENWFRPR